MKTQEGLKEFDKIFPEGNEQAAIDFIAVASPFGQMAGAGSG